jgi:hypothetical protein
MNTSNMRFLTATVEGWPPGTMVEIIDHEDSYGCVAVRLLHDTPPLVPRSFFCPTVNLAEADE